MKENKSISILGSGWLGFPLAQQLISQGHSVKISTTSERRLPEFFPLKAEPFIINIDSLQDNIQNFLNSKILIINIPSKNIESFAKLLTDIEVSEVEEVIFVSSTSVYDYNNRTILESDGVESVSNTLFEIENLFRNSQKIKATILRFSGLLGYNRNPGRFFTKGSIVSNPDANVNFIHRDDCIEIITHIILQEVWNETFNCCADTHPTKREFYTQASKSIGLPAPSFDESSSNAFKIISNAKVKAHLNYTFLHPDLMKIYAT
jgi:nucleoside-diphosphate-sugar epimerase